MVAKISVGNNLYGALAYNQKKVDQGVGKILCSNIVTEPEDGLFNIADCVADFESWMPSQFRTEKPVIHISLNPHPDDRLSDQLLAEIGEKYLQKLGYGDQPYLIFKHEDIDREHIHIVSLRVKSDGKKINDSKEHERSKAITIELEKQYGLNPAQGQRRSEPWKLSPVDIDKGNLKKQIGAVIKPSVEIYHFQTMGEYRALLSLFGVGAEEVRGLRAEKPYRGLVYHALGADGQRVGTPLKSSIFGKSVGIDALEKRMEQSAGTIKESRYRERTRAIVALAMQKSRNKVEFRASLRERGVDLVLRRTDDGRIYGATFIDHNDRSVLNGSRLGKEFSANVFNERFGGEKKNSGADLHTDLHTDLRADLLAPQSVSQNSEATHPSVLHSAQVESFHRQATEALGQPRAAQEQSSVVHSQSGEPPKLDIIGAIGSLLTGVHDSGSDDDYTQLIKKKPKKKRKFGRQM